MVFKIPMIKRFLTRSFIKFFSLQYKDLESLGIGFNPLIWLDLRESKFILYRCLRSMR